MPSSPASTVTYLVPIVSTALGIAVLVKPLRSLLLFVCVYKVGTELLRPLVGQNNFQFIERAPWIPSIGAEYFLGVDGLSVLLILLTTMMGGIATLSSWAATSDSAVANAVWAFGRSCIPTASLATPSVQSKTASGRPSAKAIPRSSRSNACGWRPSPRCTLAAVAAANAANNRVSGVASAPSPASSSGISTRSAAP